jgi:methylated-DNA-[protein]-cysteine S-methyltransferase
MRREAASPLFYTHFGTPVGPVLLTSNGAALTGLYMTDPRYGGQVQANWIPEDTASPFREAREQLTAYFAGDLTDFTLPLVLSGSTFQRQVWEELMLIPYGRTITYGEIARRLGNPNASRAVGLANGRTPVSIIVPCHRVIGSNGRLTGYGGGLTRKAALLELEASVVRDQGLATLT